MHAANTQGGAIVDRRRPLVSSLLVAFCIAIALALIPSGTAFAAGSWAATSTGCFDYDRGGPYYEDTYKQKGYKGDKICWTLRPGAAAADGVEFSLTDPYSHHWRKEIIMPDGEGNAWTIWVDPSQDRYYDANGLWAHQVHNGQQLRLRKAGWFGRMEAVINLGGLHHLKPGTLVDFVWHMDSYES